MTRFKALLVPLALAGLLACTGRAERCWVCDREIHARVRATLTLAGGRTVSACCPRCALHYKDDPKNRVGAMRVTDYRSGATLPFEKAFLVEGSDEAPCMHHPPVVDETRAPMQVCYDRCLPSLIAFGDEAGARAFMADHGGSLHPPGSLTSLPAASP
ncbi:MAG TPA: hypothetical protein VFT43_04035 [Candidatus Polarisedimenticolia bacterium]|nr:hypothetical protein [Candidatus Polarisedimenticolia bacterium]